MSKRFRYHLVSDWTVGGKVTEITLNLHIVQMNCSAESRSVVPFAAGEGVDLFVEMSNKELLVTLTMPSFI